MAGGFEAPMHCDISKEIDGRINWVLKHPGMSQWLKSALITALERDPISIVNDLEILDGLLRARSKALVKATLHGSADELESGQATTQ